MKSILVEINCPNCLWHTHKLSETVVIPEFEPDLKEQLLNETFYRFVCPRCGTRIAFFHTCVYPDKTHQFVLFMKSVKERKPADHALYADMRCVKRYLGNAHEIPEKIHILEEGLDDRILEILKVKLSLHAKQQRRTLQEVHFHDIDRASDTLWFDVVEDNHPSVQAVLLSSYHSIAQKLPKEDTAHFQSIDPHWALDYLQNTQ